MIERGIVPDDVIVFREESNETETLINRWNERYGDGMIYIDMISSQ